MTELGNRLREARIAKGLTLDNLQEITKIQKRYLIGIEEGNYSLMPGKFYVRAFIKQYAEAVELNPEQLFEEFNNEIPNSNLAEDIPGQLSRVQSRKIPTENSSKIMEWLPRIIVIILILSVFIIIWLLAQKNAGDSTENISSKKDNQEITYEESSDLKTVKKDKPTKQVDNKNEKSNEAQKELPMNGQELTTVEANGDKTIYELKNADKFNLKVVSAGETWINIKNGKGYSFYQGMLKKGETDSQTIDLSNESEVVLTVGNTTATDIYINEQKVEYAVPPTDEVKQDITIRYVKTNQ